MASYFEELLSKLWRRLPVYVRQIREDSGRKITARDPYFEGVKIEHNKFISLLANKSSQFRGKPEIAYRRKSKTYNLSKRSEFERLFNSVFLSQKNMIKRDKKYLHARISDESLENIATALAWENLKSEYHEIHSFLVILKNHLNKDYNVKSPDMTIILETRNSHLPCTILEHPKYPDLGIRFQDVIETSSGLTFRPDLCLTRGDYKRVYGNIESIIECKAIQAVRPSDLRAFVGAMYEFEMRSFILYSYYEVSAKIKTALKKYGIECVDDFFKLMMLEEIPAEISYHVVPSVEQVEEPLMASANANFSRDEVIDRYVSDRFDKAIIEEKVGKLMSEKEKRMRDKERYK